MSEANQLIEGGAARRGSRGGVSGDLRCLWMWRRSFGRLNGFLNGRAELAKGGNEMDMIFKLAIPIIMQIVEQLLSPANIIKYGDKLLTLSRTLLHQAKLRLTTQLCCR